jgi:hypothetical protein
MKTHHYLPILLLTASCSLMPAKKIYVTADGSDINNGSKNQPLRSLDAAQEAVKETRTGKPGRNIRVIFNEGTWYLTKPLSFTA